MWEFETEPEFEAKLEWCRSFVRDRVAVLDHCFGNPFDKRDEAAMALFRELRDLVRKQDLWAPHLPPEYGGQAFTHVRRVLLDEVLGPSRWAPTVFGYNPHHSGAARLIDTYGTRQQRDDYVWPLLDGEIVNCYSMSEPVVGATKPLFSTTAIRRRQGWRLHGTKWFNDNARYAALFIVVAVTDADVEPEEGMSVFLVPATTPGVEVVRDATIGGLSTDDGCFGMVRYADVHLPEEALLGPEGRAYAAVQTANDSLDLHYAGRAIGQMEAALAMMTERAATYEVRSGPLRDFQMTKEKIADARIRIDQFRLLTLHAAWRIDRAGHEGAREAIHAVKAALPGALQDVVQQAMHLCGAVGISSEMPLYRWLAWAQAVAVSDGPTETHKLGLADAILSGCPPRGTVWPSAHIPTNRARFCHDEP